MEIETLDEGLSDEWQPKDTGGQMFLELWKDLIARVKWLANLHFPVLFCKIQWAYECRFSLKRLWIYTLALPTFVLFTPKHKIVLGFPKLAIYRVWKECIYTDKDIQCVWTVCSLILKEILTWGQLSPLELLLPFWLKWPGWLHSLRIPGFLGSLCE